MAHKICCVPGCGKSRTDGVVLHMFPDPENNAERFRTWLYTIGGDILKLSNQKIAKYRYVCDCHFENKYRTWSKRLSAIAVPTLNVPGFSIGKETSRSSLSSNKPDEASASTSTCMIESKHDEFKDICFGGICDKDKSQLPITTTRAKPKRVLIQHASEASVLIRKIKHLQKSNLSYSKRLKTAMNLAENTNFQRAIKKFSAFASIFTMLQFREINKKKMGRRFTKNEKIMALALYKQGPKAYRWLKKMFVLPSPLTLSRLISTAGLKVGINENIFKNLKLRANKMQASEKLCLLMFDEIALAPHLDYNRRKDEIVGFVNNGQKTSNKLADHALVFMIRGIITNYKQPIAYSFCSGSTEKVELVRQLKEIIKKNYWTGLNVVAIVCDQAASNKSAINYLIRETKEKYLRQNKSWYRNTFEIENKEIVPLYDAPHLLKGIRNNLLTKNLTFVKNGVHKTANWDHLLKLYEKNPSFMGLRMLAKLTDHHVLPSKIKKMKVKCATQVFSKSVAIAMGYLADIGVLPKEASETAEILLFFDDLFDSVNGSYENSTNRSGKMFLKAVTPNSTHLKFWKQSIVTLKSMKFITKHGKSCTVPSLTNWVINLENLEYLTNVLFKEHNCRSIWLRHFNQDPLENFFGCVRSHGVRNTNPSCASFENSFAALLINNLNNAHSIGSNCEKDTCSNNMFKTIKKIFFSNSILDNPPVEIDLNLIIKSEEIILDYRTKINDLKVKAQMSYVTGYVLNKLKPIFKNCLVCNSTFFTNDKDSLAYISLRDYSNENKYLTYPTEAAMECFSHHQDIIIYIIRNSVLMPYIKTYTKTVLSTVCDYGFVKCLDHKNQVVAEMQDLITRFFLYNWCRDINKIIKGIRTDVEKNDRVQELARNYYIKRNKK